LYYVKVNELKAAMAAFPYFLIAVTAGDYIIYIF